MPNWVSNKMIFKDVQEKKKFIDKYTTKEDGVVSVDFNLAIPMPEELKNTVSPNRDEHQAAYLKDKYGYSDWYSWSCDKWGCKWNACDTDICDTDTPEIFFQTPWCIPEGFYREISEEFPDATVIASDEDMGGYQNVFSLSDDNYYYDNWESYSDFIKEQINDFVNATPENQSGYARAIKATCSDVGETFRMNVYIYFNGDIWEWLFEDEEDNKE